MKMILTSDLHQMIGKWDDLVKVVELERPRFVLIAGVHSTMAQGGTWTTKAPMPEPRVETAATAVNGRLYYSAIGIDYTFGVEKRSQALKYTTEENLSNDQSNLCPAYL